MLLETKTNINFLPKDIKHLYVHSNEIINETTKNT